MIVVHHLNDSRSQRILWLLEELGADYEIKRYRRDPKTLLAPPELRAVHPLGKSPVVEDGGTTLAESGAIVTWLADRYGAGKLIPAPGTPGRLRVNYWLHYAEGSAMPPLLLKLVFLKLEGPPVPLFMRPLTKGISRQVQRSFIDPQIALHLDYLEGELAKSAWFGGDAFGVADIQMSYPLEVARARGGLDADRPKLLAFLERIHARPAYQRALERGGDYSLG